MEKSSIVPGLCRHWSKNGPCCKELAISLALSESRLLHLDLYSNSAHPLSDSLIHRGNKYGMFLGARFNNWRSQSLVNNICRKFAGIRLDVGEGRREVFRLSSWITAASSKHWGNSYKLGSKKAAETVPHYVPVLSLSMASLFSVLMLVDGLAHWLQWKFSMNSVLLSSESGNMISHRSH